MTKICKHLWCNIKVEHKFVPDLDPEGVNPYFGTFRILKCYNCGKIKLPKEVVNFRKVDMDYKSL